MEQHEFNFKGLRLNGFLMILVGLLLIVATLLAFGRTGMEWMGAIGVVALIFVLKGFVLLEPNRATAMVFFGRYKGTLRRTGLSWVNPFLVAKRVSLRASNLNVEPIKVNDRAGNPILIGLVLVWRIEETYKALFEIDTPSGPSVMERASMRQAGQPIPANNPKRGFEEFVAVQSDAALREVAGHYAYDDNSASGEELTLRSGGEEINRLLEKKLNERLALAGIHVVEARLNYLAYAPEIAAVMLRRQQADAIITAREKIVEGAVSMVRMALDRLSEEQVVKLDDEHKAQMVSNLLVVLCADEPARPIVNTGTNPQ